MAASEARDTFVLKVKRPLITPPPGLPAEIKEWVKDGWGDVDGKIEIHASQNVLGRSGTTEIITFDADPKRPATLMRWERTWQEWAANERPTRVALRLFESFYELHGQIEREAEKVELVLGDGLLEWARPDGDVSHPVLLQRVQLKFDPNIPEFTIVETAQPVELYAALLRTFEEVEGNTIRKCREELDAGAYHPLDGEATTGYLRALVQRLSAKGRMLEGPRQGRPVDPVMRRDPVLFMRQRNLGFAAALDAILGQIGTGVDLPSSLLRIVGVEPDALTEGNEDTTTLGNEDEEILLCNSANQEQLQIARRLEQHGSVLVQGPPGTGKTHTIANLLGHLLAQNKTVLVTSHTTKALRVLREKVVPQLRPLCVSVLESDTEGQRQLESSISGIVERLARSDATSLHHEADSFLRQRKDLIGRLQRLRDQVRQARHNEYRDVVVDGQAFSPSNAARRVAAGREAHDWIPSPAQLGAPMPLSAAEVDALYKTNATISHEDEIELCQALPDPDKLPSPVEF